MIANKAGLLGYQTDGKGAEKWWIEGEGRRVSLSAMRAAAGGRGDA